MAEQDKEFIEYLVEAIVDNPKDVKVERTVDEMGVLIVLTVNPADMGKIIGKEGNTAKAIRTLLRVLGAKNNARINLKIAEPVGGRGPLPRVERPVEEKREEPIKEEPAEASEEKVEEKKPVIAPDSEEENTTSIL